MPIDGKSSCKRTTNLRIHALQWTINQPLIFGIRVQSTHICKVTALKNIKKCRNILMFYRRLLANMYMNTSNTHPYLLSEQVFNGKNYCPNNPSRTLKWISWKVISQKNIKTVIKLRQEVRSQTTVAGITLVSPTNHSIINQVGHFFFRNVPNGRHLSQETLLLFLWTNTKNRWTL